MLLCDYLSCALLGWFSLVGLICCLLSLWITSLYDLYCPQHHFLYLYFAFFFMFVLSFLFLLFHCVVVAWVVCNFGWCVIFFFSTSFVIYFFSLFYNVLATIPLLLVLTSNFKKKKLFNKCYCFAIIGHLLSIVAPPSSCCFP